MRILVTGGTGFVGCHTVAALLEAGNELRLLVRSRDRIAPALGPVGVDPAAVEVAVGDVTDRASVREAIAGCDAVVHVASVWSLDPRRADEMTRVNAAGTEAVLGAAAAARLDPIVHISSYAALLPPLRAPLDGDSPIGTATVPYCASKAASERIARDLQERGAPIAITYPGMVWGPHDPHLGETSPVALLALGGRLPALAPGTLAVSDVRDLAAVHAALAVPGRGARRYPVGGGDLPVVEVMRTAVRLTGRRLPAVTVPAPVAAASAVVGEALARMGIDLLPTREAAWLASQDAPLDPSSTVRDLGVSFRPPEESIRDTVRWLHAAGHLSARRAGALAQAA